MCPVVDRACGQLTGGRHLRTATDTPMANLLVSILEKVGVEADRIGAALKGFAGELRFSIRNGYKVHPDSKRAAEQVRAVYRAMLKASANDGELRLKLHAAKGTA